MDAFQRWSYIPETLFDVELDEAERPEFDRVLTSIRTARDRSPSHRAAPHDEILIFNESGSKPPIVWCFNNWSEPYLLAYQLDSDQPLVATESPHAHEPRWVKKARFTEPLAKTYLDSVLKIYDGRDLIIGGNCQGAPIAESMSIQMASRFHSFPRLITVDYVPKRAYSGDTLMLFGHESPFNPFLHQRDPVKYWEGRLKSFGWGFLQVTHGSYFLEPTILQLKDYILRFHSVYPEGAAHFALSREPTWRDRLRRAFLKFGTSGNA